MPSIRPVTTADAPELARIYGHHVLHGTGTFEEAPPSVDEMARRIAGIVDRGWPWLVAERGGVPLGYAYAGQFRDRSAYRPTCEDALYVAPGAVGQGLGTVLLAGLIDAARAAGFRQMIAVIGDSGNAASIGVHAKAGFAKAGRLRDVGVKFGRLLDVVLMQRTL